MKKVMLMFVSIFLAVTLLNISNANSTVINVKSCSQTDVQAAITAATTGDVVIIPVCRATWTSQVAVPPTKKITLKGNGQTNTVITLSISTNIPGLTLSTSGSRLTAMRFILPYGTENAFMVEVKGNGWVIDNCTFDNQTLDSRISITANGTNISIPPKGLISHCSFLNGRIGVGGLGTFAKMNGIWADALNLGTDDAVYVEDCTFTRTDGYKGNVIDTNRGGKYVFRYNTVTDSNIMAHSLQAANERGSRKWEIYNNTLIATKSNWGPLFIRGGTGVIFNNTIIGPWSDRNIIIDNVRSCSLSVDENVSLAGRCDGDHLADGNVIGKAGYWCRDQIGRSTDAWLWTDAKPYPPQALEPAYFWNNKYSDGSDIGVTLHSCTQSQNHIQQNRDWYFGMPKPGYTPYTYPHPLISPEPLSSLEPLNKPAPPRSLKIIPSQP